MSNDVRWQMSETTSQLIANPPNSSEAYGDELEAVDLTIAIENFILSFSVIYDEIHIPLSIFICIFGFFSHIVNVIVLTRRRMRTPINILLTGLSAAQWLLATNYLLFLIVEYYRMHCSEFIWGKAMTYYRYFSVNLNIVFHTTAFMTTIILAIFRYCALKYPIQASRYLYKSQLAVVANFIVWVVVPIISAPVWFSSKVTQIDNNSVIYKVNCTMTTPMYDLNYPEDQTIVSVVFWMFGIVLKLIPSILLTGLLIALIRSLNSVERRRNKWKREHSAGNIKMTNSEKKAKKKFSSRPRTTRMLVIILLLCVVVEFPNGLLNLCFAIYGEEFGARFYNPLGNLIEMMTLLYSSVSFILYCTMSNDFLTTFRILFLPWTVKEGSQNGRGIQPNQASNSYAHQSMMCVSNANVHLNGAERSRGNCLPNSFNRISCRRKSIEEDPNESQLALLIMSTDREGGWPESAQSSGV